MDIRLTQKPHLNSRHQETPDDVLFVSRFVRWIGH